MSDTSHHVLTGKVDITSNLLVGSSHLFVDTENNRVGLVTTDPQAGLHVNSNAYVNTDLRVGPAGPNQVVINATAGRIKAASFEGDGSLLQNTPPGADGAAATIAVGTTTTGAAGTSASVTNSGTTSAAVFDFVIPKGDKGDTGDPGAPGTDGTNYFTLSGSNIYRTTGRVGIGTTSPRALLDVSGPTGIPAILTSGANDSEGDIAVPTGQAVQIGHWDDETSTFTNRFYISSSGDVGIGETSPRTTLHVKSVSTPTGTGDAFVGGLGGNTANRKPTECLRLTGQYVDSTGSGSLLRFTNYHTGGTNPNTYEYNTAGIAGFDYNNSWGGGLVLYTAPGTSGGGDLTPRMIINNDGDVGINRTNPACALDIAGEDVMIRGNTPSLHFSEGTNGMDGAFRIHYDGANQVDGNNFLAIQYGTNFADTSLHCTLGGNVGIATSSPEQNLHVHESGSGQVVIAVTNDTTGGGSNDGIHFGIDSSEQGFVWHKQNTALLFATNNAERMRIDNAGNVGIGTSPEEKLHVAGHMTVRGSSRFDVRTDDADHIIAGNWYSSADSLCLVSAGSININMDYNANDTNKVIDFRTNTSTDGGTLLMRLKEGGSVLIGDQHEVANYSSAQFILGGTHNSGFNNNNQIKLLITGGNNDNGAPKYIQCEDENGYDIFIVKGATSEGGGNALLYIKGEVKMASGGTDTYAFEPYNDGWLRLKGASSGQGNTYNHGSHKYTSLALAKLWAWGSTRYGSDDRIKHFEEEIPNALELIQQLKPYKYKKTSKIYDEDYTGDIGEDWEWEIGLIAQDVEKIPYLEHTVSKPEDSPGDTYGLNYTEFIGVCIQGIKDLRKELQSEKEKVATMELLVASLVKRVGDLENLVI